MGTARTMMPAEPTTSSVVTGRAPGASTSTISAMRSGGPEPEMAMSYPALIAARATVVPIFPAPTMPRRRSVGLLLDIRGSVIRRRRRTRGCRLGGWLREQLSDAWNHLAPIELDRRHSLLVRHSPSGIRPVESAEPELPNHRGNLGRHGFRRSEIQRSVCDLGLESLHRRARPSSFGGCALKHLRPVRPLNRDSFFVRPGHESV